MVKKYNATQSEPKLVAYSSSIRQLLCKQRLHTKISSKTSPTIFLQSSAILHSDLSPSNQQQTDRTKSHPTFFFFDNLLRLDVHHNMEEKMH